MSRAVLRVIVAPPPEYEADYYERRNGSRRRWACGGTPPHARPWKISDSLFLSLNRSAGDVAACFVAVA